MKPTLAEILTYLETACGPLTDTQRFFITHHAAKADFAGVARAPGRIDYRPAFIQPSPRPGGTGIYVLSRDGYADDATAAGATSYPNLPPTT